MSMQSRKLFVAIFLFLAMVTSDVLASGFYVARFGGEHGHPTTDNLSAIYYNPAGLSLGAGTRLTIDANLAWRAFSYERPEEAIDNPLMDSNSREAGTPADAISSNAGEATLSNQIASPFIAVASDFGIEGFSAGLGFYVPFGGSSVYDQKDNLDNYPGAIDGPQRWWAIEGTIRSLYVTGAVGYRIEPLRLSIGAGLNIVKSEVFTVRARNSNGKDHVSTEGRALLDVSGTELSLGAGIIWEPSDGLFLGVSYQSAPNFGESELEGTAKLALAGTAPTQPKVSYFQSMPEVWHAGIRWRMDPKNEVRLFGNYITWSNLKHQCALDQAAAGSTCELDGSAKLILLPRAWNNAYAIRFGASHWLTEKLELIGGGGYDANAVPDQVLEPALFDTDKFTVALGVKVQLSDASAGSGATHFAATYTQVIYEPRNVSPRGREEGAAETNIEQFGFVAAQRQPDAAGTYEQSIGVLNLNVEYTF